MAQFSPSITMEEIHHAANQYYHEHCSDDECDSDDDLEHDLIRRRIMSEEKSFHSPSSVGANKLHHRTSRQTTSEDDLRSKSMSPLRHNGRRSRPIAPPKKRTCWGRTMRWFILILVIGYVVLMSCGYFWLRSHHRFNSETALSRSSFLEPKGRLYILRERLEQKRLDERNEMAYQASAIAAKRSFRIKPPRLLSQVDQYEISLMAPKETIATSVIKPAKLHDICGDYARNASRSNPNAFATRNVLNSKSRVLITGILNPIGFHLALALKERCGVEVMAGIDPAFPNTVAHRLAIQKRIELLSTNIPKLTQPILLPLVGLDPKPSKRTPVEGLSMTGEMNLVQMRPTHIVHLASYVIDEYQDFGNEELRNKQSPYVGEGRTPEMFAIRSSHVSMEQILLSILEGDRESYVEQPQFLYASTAGTANVMQKHTKVVDEILADSYSSLYGIHSTGLRLPNTIYGPWGRTGSSVHDLSKAAIDHQRHSNGTILTVNDTQHRDLVYVDDVINAIIAAMQYRQPKESLSLLDLSSDSRSTLKSASLFVSRLVHSKPNKQLHEIAAPKAIMVEPTALVKKTRDVLKWSPTTSLSTGLAKTLAWYLDDAFPYGDKIDSDRALETGDQLRARLGLESCAPQDLLCHMGRKYLPCLSECSTKDQCTPSLYEGVAKLVLELTEGCDIVLYMQALGYDLQDIKLQATYKEEGVAMICNFAFVPEESRLVNAVIKKVPESKLGQFGIKPDSKESSEAYKQRKIEGLNGRLLYKGWILVWVKDAHKPVDTHDMYALKLSPGRFFSSDVKHAVYVDESFPVSPTHDDVLFLVGQTHRPPLPDRNAYRKLENGKKVKYRLAAEPERRAVILMSPLKYKKAAENGDQAKISIYEATKYMQVEIGENPEEKESSGMKKQREFYERVPTFTNRLDFRSINEPWYKYEMKHWARTRWIVHDMKLEEARQLRCDWYQEHVQWDNELDQLSFAQVMAVRELERRIAFQEPDDHIKPPWFDKPELLHLTDGHEWHSLQNEENRMTLDNLPSSSFTIVADHLVDEDEKEHGPEDGLVHNVELPKAQSEGVPLFVRVVSEQVMLKARIAWGQAHNAPQK